MTSTRSSAAPSLRRLRVLVAMVVAVSIAAIAAVVVLQNQEREARKNEGVARIYAASLRQAITDLVPAGDVLANDPPPVLVGLIKNAMLRSVRQLETIRDLDPSRASELEALIVRIREADVITTQARRTMALEGVTRASSIADGIARRQHRLAERAERRSLLGTAGALAFAILAVLAIVSRDRRRSLADAAAHTAVIRRLADHDSLTDLPNRRRFDADLDAIVGTAGAVEIAVCDLNGFKAINDRFGHDAGDAVLVRVARDLQTTVGTAGTVYRTGGDEFCVISEPGLRVADLARAALERDESTTVGSVGAASHPSDHHLAREVVRLADRRMYAAKRAIAAGAPASEARTGR